MKKVKAGIKRAVILLHGELDIGDFQLQGDDFLICADGGTEHAGELGWVPDLVIGDMDSISPILQQQIQNRGVELSIFPVEKDQTDGELALDYALGLEVEEIVILGALGGRVDHMLSNIFMLSQGAHRKVQIISGRQRLQVIDSQIEIQGQVGDWVSLIPLTPEVSGIFTTGLYYELRDGTLAFGSSLGNSNRMIESVATVKIHAGKLLVVHLQDK
ncbi:MAG: thiamine diphosphokinase [Firmicutes bacterium]|nr:thiamine diphosphokinase [Bacillota bacterium]